jgi:hypothetical protein
MLTEFVSAGYAVRLLGGRVSCCGFTVCGGRTVTAPFHQRVTLYVSLKDSCVVVDATYADAAF